MKRKLYQRDRRRQPPVFGQDCKTSVARSPTDASLSLANSLGGTTGPDCGGHDRGPLDSGFVGNFARKDGPILVRGRASDKNDRPMSNMRIQRPQAKSADTHAHPQDRRVAKAEDGCRGWGRVISGLETRLWSCEALMPDSSLGQRHMTPLRPAEMQMRKDADGRAQQELRPAAPDRNLWIAAQGVDIGPDTLADETADAADPALGLIEQEERCGTLLPNRERCAGILACHFDIRLQGNGGTVFLEI